MKRLNWLFVFGFCLLALGSSAQGIEFQHDKSFDDILKMAKAQNKLIFMDCYTNWCGPCKRLASGVFPDPKVGAVFNERFINAKFEMEKDADGPSISSRYGIRAYPTLLWLDGDGKEVYKHVGGLDVDGLIAEANKATDPTPGILAGMKTKYAGGARDADFVSDYLNTLNASGAKYDDVFKEYVDKLTPAELQSDKHQKTIFNLTNDLKSIGLPVVMKNKPVYVKLMGELVFNAKMNKIAEDAVKAAPRADDAALFEGALNLLKTNKAPDMTEKTLQLSMLYYAKMNDWVNYDKNAQQYVKKFVMDKPKELNDVAWTYFLNVDDRAQLQKASEWAYKALNTDNKYTYNLTYAYLQYKLKNYKEAERACDYAILRANAEKVAPTSATALKDAVKKSLTEQ